MVLIHDHEIPIFMRWRSPCTFAEHRHQNHQIDGCKGKPKSGREYVCQGLNSRYFHIIGDGHQPNSRDLYTLYKDSY